tara:strand:- start:56 stop:667 length:612 start_codon:yes stop_codon:yes gene_type:complete
MTYKVKVSVIGNFAVGKSSILNTLNNKKDYCTQSTLGVDFFYKNFTYENETFKFHIWDTAGQERFRAIVKSYFRDLDVVILVFDVTDLYGLEQIEKWDTDLEYINKNENIIKILVGNKIDSNNRCINEIDAQEISNKYGYTYFETSSKEEKTIHNLFNNIVKIVHQQKINKKINLKKTIDYKDKNTVINSKINKKKFKWCNII